MGGHIFVPCGIIPSQDLMALPDDIVEHRVGGDACTFRQDSDTLLMSSFLVQRVAVVIQVAEIPPHGRIKRGQFLQGLLIQFHPRPLPGGLPSLFRIFSLFHIVRNGTGYGCEYGCDSGSRSRGNDCPGPGRPPGPGRGRHTGYP